MLDLETLGNTPGSIIVSIGAVKFTNSTDTVGITDEFYIKINPEDAAKHGLHMDVSCIQWWLKQNEKARLEVASLEGAFPLDLALRQFGVWAGHVDELWGDGSDFDNVLLACAYRKTDIALPWSFRANRCYRTIKNLNKDIPYEGGGVAHHALDDARAQAYHLMKIENK